MPIIRAFHPSDLPALYRVCLLTGNAGRDASELHRDPDLMGHVWAGPYAVADPSLAFVVADDEGVAGYVLGTADSVGFAAWEDEHWWPVLRERYPPREDPRDGTRDHVQVGYIHHPAHDDPPPGHPAHLHIDLLPRVQRQGWGRRLIETFAGALRERGVPGVHLAVDPANTAARAFYARLGFVPDEVGRLLLPISR